MKICVLKEIHHWLSVLTTEASKENKEFRRSSLLILCLNDSVNCSYTVSHFEPNEGRTYCNPVQELKNSLEEIGCTKKIQKFKLCCLTAIVQTLLFLCENISSNSTLVSFSIKCNFVFMSLPLNIIYQIVTMFTSTNYHIQVLADKPHETKNYQITKTQPYNVSFPKLFFVVNNNFL